MTDAAWTAAWRQALREWDRARDGMNDATGPYTDVAVLELMAAEARLTALWTERPRRPA
jgi:hypothetical protein